MTEILDRAAVAATRDRDRSESTRPSAPRGAFQRHIQGLRAVAVAAVVLYHLWPSRLTGGFVGVDVFFVISGFLIYGHLAREVVANGSIRLAAFWARRIRRLMPASLTVLLCSGIFVVLFMPMVAWDRNLGDIRAAAVYAENWHLALDAVDYLASQADPSIVQHYWSLSVEEQFYFALPLLMVVALRLSRSRRALVALLVATVALSFPYSIAFTSLEPGAAYFSTGTRAWEFALGGLASIASGRLLPPAVRRVLAWCGLALVLGAILAFSGSTVFPGAAAALPAVGTALLLRYGSEETALSPGGFLSFRAMQWLGDHSYSLYLWHWPLIVALPVVLGGPAGWRVKIGILLSALLLATVTKRWVEDRWRRTNKALPWRQIGITAVCVGLLAAAATGGVAWKAQRTAALVADAPSASAGDRCVGIDAVVNHCAQPFAVTSTVVPAASADDVPWNVGIAASKNCPGGATDSAPIVRACVFNAPENPSLTVALVGDSHADHLIDALSAYAGYRGWRFMSFTREGCSGVPSREIGNEKCERWSEAVQQELLTRPGIDAVVFSNYASAASWTAGDLQSVWTQLRGVGRTVVPVVDVPGMGEGQHGPECVAAHMTEYDPCTTPIPRAGKTQIAARRLGLPVVDLTDLLCHGGRCHSVIGGQVVYMDEAHLTYHFSFSLRNVLGSRVEGVIDRARS